MPLPAMVGYAPSFCQHLCYDFAREYRWIRCRGGPALSSLIDDFFPRYRDIDDEFVILTVISGPARSVIGFASIADDLQDSEVLPCAHGEYSEYPASTLVPRPDY